MVLVKTLRYLSSLCPGRCPGRARRRPRRIGQYDFHEKLGSGGTGDVYRVTNAITGEEMACKEVRRSKSARAAKEISILRTVKGDHLQKFNHSITRAGCTYILSHYNGGTDLFDLLVDHGPFDEGELRPLAREMVESLHECGESKVAHLDVKLENFVTKGSSVELIDFGSAHRLADSSSEHRLDCLTGTTGYASPEVYQGSFFATSDVWSLGVCFWILNTGAPPFLKRHKRHISDAQDLVRAHIFPTRDHDRQMRYMTAGLRDIFRGIFLADPRARMTIEELRSHPWMKRST